MQNKNNNIVKYVGIAVGVIVAIAMAVFVLGIVFKEDKPGNSNSLAGGNSSPTDTSYYQVKFKGFKFNIPNDFIYEEDTDSLMISNEEGTWYASLQIESGSFSQLKSNKSQMKQILEKNGYTSSMAVEKTLGGVEFIILEIGMGGTNAIMGLSKGNSMYYIAVTVLNEDNEFDYSVLEKLATIVKDPLYTGEASNIETGKNIDINGFSSLAQ